MPDQKNETPSPDPNLGQNAKRDELKEIIRKLNKWSSGGGGRRSTT
ncbi:hypothetical protein SBI_06663 [Streptomyces bingchenggensis BCW-1]|uniref:Uncharacterized protein n=1 Tax=Streptomyces bingchenggensis (strain BCW-1) TaxID=749414 RepID=D7BXN5_STRBB|nr:MULTISPECIES: hypothetical protein [Streptomyces]ADI09783.1 hypothetical protein SBI_06663 [Streptomyces bingchenggensis BCW-1]